MLTYLPKDHVQSIIELSAHAIRRFLGTADPVYFKGDAKAAIKAYQENPLNFSDHALIAMGAHIDSAHQHPVRIELRGVNYLGAAQVVAKGVWGAKREEVVEGLRQDLKRQGIRVLVRTAGSSSFEFNQLGVDKSLPLNYLRVALSRVLEQMKYAPGSLIDASKTRTVIASDGDGTVYDGPRTTHVPTLKESPVFNGLLTYLKAGGIFMLVSGNDVNRTFKRLIDGLPPEFYNRVLLSANGGADLVTIDDQGNPIFDQHYRTHALALSTQAKKQAPLDIVYIGDDGSPNGNDRAAFETVGFDRCVLVADTFEKVFEPLLLPVYVGKTVMGTKQYLDIMNEWIAKHPHQPVFNNNLHFCKQANHER